MQGLISLQWQIDLNCKGVLMNQATQWAKKSLASESFSDDECLSILNGPSPDLIHVLAAAFDVRQKYFGKTVKLHILDNAQNGLCPEDCSYCGQSKQSKSGVREYPLKSQDELLTGARQAKESGAHRYCMVLSGRGPSLRAVKHMAAVITEIKKDIGIGTCLSVGLMDQEKAQILKEAGLDRLNHNVNTSQSHYPNICTTHTYKDRLNTIQAAYDAGLEVCSGMIAGMGETDSDIIEVARALRSVNAQSIPVNFLIPMEGNPIKANNDFTPERALRVLCLFRFLNPRAEIRAAAGREGYIRQSQVMLLYPANSLFVEGYLLTKGQGADPAIQMIIDAGFDIEGGVPEGTQIVKGFQRMDQGAFFKDAVNPLLT